MKLEQPFYCEVVADAPNFFCLHYIRNGEKHPFVSVWSPDGQTCYVFSEDRKILSSVSNRLDAVELATNHCMHTFPEFYYDNRR